MSHPYFSPRFTLKNGPHGKGVLTTASIKKDETLFRMHGRIIRRPTRLSIQIAENKHIEDVIASQMNHSCFPNTKVDRNNQSIVSIRNIEKGEEITLDYNENEDKVLSPFRCKCCDKEIRGRQASGVEVSLTNEAVAEK